MAEENVTLQSIKVLVKLKFLFFQDAYARILPHIHVTPVFENTHLNELTQKQLFFKCENFQKVGAFKIRGATNAVFSLDEKEAQSGVVTHSSGNHAQAYVFLLLRLYFF